MAIIPSTQKILTSNEAVNTTYGGSQALKELNTWYTMQDIADSVSAGGAPTLQQVTEAGNTTNQPITVSVEGGIGIGGYSTSSTGSTTGVVGGSFLGRGVYGSSSYGVGVYGDSFNTYGVSGFSNNSYGGYFSSGVTYSLVAAQSAAKPGGGSWSVFSDSRIKENIIPYTKGLEDILLINTVTYEYNGLAGTNKGAKYTGIIAQEIKEIFPDTVKTYKTKLNEEDEEKTELYDFNASDLTFALINAVKELNEKIKILETK